MWSLNLITKIYAMENQTRAVVTDIIRHGKERIPIENVIVHCYENFNNN